MGILDEIEASFGPDALKPSNARTTYDRWHELCVCGHIDRYHGPSVGGSYPLKTGTSPDPRDGAEGARVPRTQVLDGCLGAVQKGWISDRAAWDDETQTVIERLPPTCPCTQLRPIVRVNRPNRYFNQRMPADRSDPSRHPFIVGVRAFTTHLSKRKDANPEKGGTPEWATAEFLRRFIWIDGARTCSISRCTTADESVWPCFVNGEALSELRCGSHRPG
jgi:hypothetical protein